MTNTVEQLKKMLASSKAQDRLNAIEILYQNGDSKSLPVLKQLAVKDSSIEVRYMAQRSIFLLSIQTDKISDGIKSADGNISINTDKFISSYLENDNNGKKQLLKSAVKHNAGDMVEFLKEQAVTETDPVLKGTIIVAIAILGGTEQIKFLSQFGNAPDPLVRHHLIEGLGQINSPSVYPLICSYLSDEDKAVKLRVVGALKKLGKDALVQLLDHMLDSEQFWMRDSAAYALSVLSSAHFLPLLKKGMRDPDRRVREKIRRGIELLIDKGCTEAKSLLHKFSDMTMAFQDDGVEILASIPIGAGDGEDPLFSAVGAHRLSETKRIINEGDDQRLSPLSAAIQNEEDPMILTQMLKAISIIGTNESITYIEKCLSANEANVRMTAVEAISSLSANNDVDCLDPLLYDDSPMVRASAVVALRTIYPGPTLRTLEEMAEDDDVSFRNGAVYALSAIADDSCLPIIKILANDSDPGIKEQMQLLIQQLPDDLRKLL